jgi:hypothetical protein
MAETLQSHLAHPVLSFYRAQHWGQSWMVSVATILDTCTLVIVAGEGVPAAQARLTYQMGLRLLQDLSHALGVEGGRDSHPRVSEADLPAIAEAIRMAGLRFELDQVGASEFLELTRQYETHLVALSDWLLIPISGWLPSASAVERKSRSES